MTLPLPAPALLAAQVSDINLQAACPDEDGINAVCAAAYRLTGNGFVSRVAGTVVPAAGKILLILLLAYVANRILKRLIKRFTRSLAGEGMRTLGVLRSKSPLSDTGPLDLARASMRTETLGSVLRSVTTFTVWAVAAMLVLGELRLDPRPLIAGAGIAGVALGFGAQNLVKDFLSGMFMLIEDQYGIGDVVDVGEAVGSVEAITLRTTRLRDLEGTVWHVPNGEIRRVGNKSQQWARAVLDIGVAYETDTDHAIAVIKRVADELWQDPEWVDQIMDEPEVWGIERFGINEVTIRMVVKTRPLEQWAVGRELRARIKAAFDTEGIEIPFPQRMLVGAPDGAGDASAPAPEQRT